MWRSGEAACGCIVQTGPDPLRLTLAAILHERPFFSEPDVGRVGKVQVKHWYHSTGFSLD